MSVLRNMARRLRACARGCIVLVDRNNPLNPAVRARLRTLYAELEGEQGAYFRLRRNIIDGRLPASAPNDDLVRATCDRPAQEIAALIALRCGALEATEASYFDPDVLRPPWSMQANELPSSPTDPEFFRATFVRCGVECVVGLAHPPPAARSAMVHVSIPLGASG